MATTPPPAAAALYLGLTQCLIAAFLSHSDAGLKREEFIFFFKVGLFAIAAS